MAINSATPRVGKILDLPNTPTVGTATAGAELATVAYTLDTVGGPAYSVTALSNPGSITGTGTSSPVTVSGLTAGTAYTFTVRTNNPSGSSAYSSASNSVTPTSANSYESIATANGTGSSGTITFSSIPSTYQHLQIRYIGRVTNADTADNIFVQFNSDTGSNYAWHYLQGDGSSAVAGAASSQSKILAGRVSAATATTEIMGAGVLDLLDYANTNKYKTLRTLSGQDRNGGGVIVMTSGLWQNTAAVSTITITNGSATNFTSTSTFALYGIKG